MDRGRGKMGSVAQIENSVAQIGILLLKFDFVSHVIQDSTGILWGQKWMVSNQQLFICMLSIQKMDC